MNWLQLSSPSPALIKTVSMPRARARAAIRAGSPPWALETYQIHIPSPRNGEPSASVGAVGGCCCGAAVPPAGAISSASSRAAAAAIERRAPRRELKLAASSGPPVGVLQPQQPRRGDRCAAPASRRARLAPAQPGRITRSSWRRRTESGSARGEQVASPAADAGAREHDRGRPARAADERRGALQPQPLVGRERREDALRSRRPPRRARPRPRAPRRHPGRGTGASGAQRRRAASSPRRSTASPAAGRRAGGRGSRRAGSRATIRGRGAAYSWRRVLELEAVGAPAQCDVPVDEPAAERQQAGDAAGPPPLPRRHLAVPGREAAEGDDPRVDRLAVARAAARARASRGRRRRR